MTSRQSLINLGVLLLLAAAVWVVFSPALAGPYIYDDYKTVVYNDTIVKLFPLTGPLHAPPVTSVSARPLVNLTLAANYAVGKLDPRGYRLFNMALHVASAMFLFGIVRRTLMLKSSVEPGENSYGDTTASILAFGITLLWTIHPLQTETVCYITQRTELMMGLCYLATLYGSLRYFLSDVESSSRRWLAFAVVACFAGMASKEVMVTAPVMVFLFDGTFISKTAGEAVRRSWPLYLGLMLSWGLLYFLIADLPRSDTAGFHLGVSAVSWWATQCKVLVMYLKLVFWPWPLAIYYEMPLLNSVGAALLWVVPIALLATGTLVALLRRLPVGFLGAWFFGILAPTSFVPIISEIAADRRMYLPLAAVIVLVIVGGYRCLRILADKRADTHSPQARPLASIILLAAVLVPSAALGWISREHLSYFADEITIWQELVERYPQSDRAHVNLGDALMNAHRNAEAAKEFAATLAINPRYTEAHYNWGLILKDAGSLQAAAEHLAASIQLDPERADNRRMFGQVLNQLGRPVEAAEQLAIALKLEPQSSFSHYDLGLALKNAGRLPEALPHFAEAARLNPSDANFHNNYGNALSALGDYPHAIEQFDAALAINPKLRESLYNRGITLSATGRGGDARTQFERLVEVYPEDVPGHFALANALLESHDKERAVEHYKRAVVLDPKLSDAWSNLGAVLLDLGRIEDAIQSCQQAKDLNPSSAVYRFNLADSLGHSGRKEEAITEARQALELAKAANQPEIVAPINAWLLEHEAVAPKQ